MELENEILQDPLDALPLGSWVQSDYPKLENKPAGSVRKSVNKSKTGIKELCWSGSEDETEFEHAANVITSEFVEFVREYFVKVENIRKDVITARTQVKTLQTTSAEKHCGCLHRIQREKNPTEQ